MNNNIKNSNYKIFNYHKWGYERQKPVGGVYWFD